MQLYDIDSITDYENGKYMIGKTHDLEGYGMPEGVHAP